MKLQDENAARTMIFVGAAAIILLGRTMRGDNIPGKQIVKQSKEVTDALMDEINKGGK